MLRGPRDFAVGARPPGGGRWVIPAAGEDQPEMEWRVNPRLACPPGALHAVRLWFQSRGGMGGAGPLPDAGGLNDQAAWLMHAFNLIAAADDEWSEAERERRG